MGMDCETCKKNRGEAEIAPLLCKLFHELRAIRLKLKDGNEV